MFFQTLSNPLRVAIISSLEKSPKSVNELAKDLKVEQSKLSHALKAMSTCHIVEAEQKGKQRIYSVNKNILPILKMINKHGCECCKKCCKIK
jgi:DNA-binding transcriptional ArsR family regulator